MITFTKQQIKKTLGILLIASLVSTHYLSAAISPALQKNFSQYYQEYPWIGLIANETHYGPITVSNVHIDGIDKLAVVKAGELIHGDLHYKIDSSVHSKFRLHHLVVGIVGTGTQDCVAHSLNLWDSDSEGKFTLQAPSQPGIYEVRFTYSNTSGNAESWDSVQKFPPASATIGVIIVE